MRHTKFTAGLLALSLAAGVAATPVRAGDEDVARALGGLLTLFVIGKAIENANKGKVTVETGRGAGFERGRPEWKRDDRSAEIPAACVFETRSYRQMPQRIAGQPCLARSGVHTAHFPQICRTTIRTREGSVPAYDVNCLSGYGVKVADAARHRH